MPSVVITGANRGIGLALARRYVDAGWEVHGTARAPEAADDLRGLPGVTVYRLDVSEQASIDAFAKAMEGRPIDHLVNNAGVMGSRDISFGRSQLEDWIAILGVNTAAPWLVTERLAGNLEAGDGKRVAVITSQLGSITNASLGWPPIYAASKAGANMVKRQLSLILGEKGIVTIALHPGWVRTAMGGPDATVTPEDSAAGIFRMMTTATPEMNGCFFNYDGTSLPW